MVVKTLVIAMVVFGLKLMRVEALLCGNGYGKIRVFWFIVMLMVWCFNLFKVSWAPNIFPADCIPVLASQ